MSYCTHICRQDVLDTIMGCAQKFSEIQTNRRSVIFLRQIEAQHEKLEKNNFKLFKQISLKKRISEANKEISIKVSHEYTLYMQEVLEGTEADEAFENLEYFRSYPSTRNLVSRREMQEIMSEDFSEEIQRMVDAM